MSSETVSADRYAKEGLAALERVIAGSRDAVAAAARLIADCVEAGGVIQAFGTGHSQASVAEVVGRAGGLIPTNRISLTDVVLFGGESPDAVADPLLERASGISERLYDLAAPHPEDVFVIVSNSGVNATVVEMAQRVKERGHKLIGVTSLAHSHGVKATHPSGTRLADIADVVLENGAPLGDALLTLDDGTAICGVSTLTSTMLIQMTVAEAVALMLADGVEPPVYVSSNLPGGHERNLTYENRYPGRLRRIGF